MFVLWGGRAGDVQVGSDYDRALGLRARVIAKLRREVRATQFPALLEPRILSGYRVGNEIRFDLDTSMHE